MRAEELTVGNQGAQLFRAALSMTQLGDIEGALVVQPRDQTGVRLSGIPELRPFLGPRGPVGRIPASVLGPECLPVRAILFDKSAVQNWSLGWHQDRTIAVRQPINVDEFGPWSIKGRLLFKPRGIFSEAIAPVLDRRQNITGSSGGTGQRHVSCRSGCM